MVELELTEPLELSLQSIKGVETVISRSMDDVSIIEVKLKPTVPDGEVEQTWDFLRRKVNDVRTSLPSGAHSSESLLKLDNTSSHPFVYGV